MSERTIIVTGGGTGIGKAIAAAFVADGESVILIGRRREALEAAARELAALGPPPSIQPCDVTRPEDVERTFAAFTGPLDVLVNNAGGRESLPEGASLEQAARYVDETLRRNVMGTYLMTRAAAGRLRRPGGRVVNISSVGAVRGGTDVYAAAKGAILALTYSQARQLGPDGITVNAVAPGVILDTEFFGADLPEAFVESVVAEVPLGRLGMPNDVAAGVRYLASEEASYVTGEVHHINGGWVFGR
jgi:3-oxoacyl-[acyl-carrier protein] reductase